MPLTIVHPLPWAAQTPDPCPAARAQAPPHRAPRCGVPTAGASCSPGRRPRCRSHFLRSLTRSRPAPAPAQAARPERAAGKDGAGGEAAAHSLPAEPGRRGRARGNPQGEERGWRGGGGQPQGAGGTLAGSCSASRSSNGLGDAGQRSPGPPRRAGFVLHGPRCSAGGGGGSWSQAGPAPTTPRDAATPGATASPVLGHEDTACPCTRDTRATTASPGDAKQPLPVPDGHRPRHSPVPRVAVGRPSRKPVPPAGRRWLAALCRRRARTRARARAAGRG